MARMAIPIAAHLSPMNNSTLIRKPWTAALAVLLTLSLALSAAPLSAQEAGRHHQLSLRTNLLRLATLTPDIGAEWRIGEDWGALVDGSWTSWSWGDMRRRHALWEIAPQVRRYIGAGKCGYIGAMFKAGEFNYKQSSLGRQGDIIGGGLVGGWKLRLGGAFALDFSLGLGCLHADYERYEVVRGVRVRRGDRSGTWWGPVSAGVTLVWDVF